jgi:hypothetical protein
MRLVLNVLALAFVISAILFSPGCGKGEWIMKIDGTSLSIKELDELYYAHHKQILQQLKFDVTNEDVDKFAADFMTVKRLPTLNKEIFLNEVINQRLIYDKAVEAGMDSLPEVKAMIKIAQDTAVVQYYIREKFKNDLVVSDQEVEAFYNENRANFKMEPIDQAEKKIRQYLGSQKLLKKMKKFVDDLKDVARIEKNPNYEKMLQPKSGSAVQPGDLQQVDPAQAPGAQPQQPGAAKK